MSIGITETSKFVCQGFNKGPANKKFIEPPQNPAGYHSVMEGNLNHIQTGIAAPILLRGCHPPKRNSLEETQVNKRVIMYDFPEHFHSPPPKKKEKPSRGREYAL